MQGIGESGAKTFLTFRASTKCMKIGKAGRKLSLRLETALYVGKSGRRGEEFPYV